ncbi:MAG: ribonuclease R [Candidatus Pacebacteria bacterium]|nr:ribonuclease R [Candidatus Paceibacterota bacterium]
MDTQLYEGVIMVRGKGTGFIKIPDETEDVVIERDALGFALDGDIVEIKLKPKVAGKRLEGAVTRVITPAWRELIGTVKEKTVEGKSQYFLAPDNHRIHIRPVLGEATANDLGMKVAIEITSWMSAQTEPVAKIIEVLGRAGDHETEMQAIIRSGGFTKTFPEAVQKEAHDLYERRAEIFAAAEKDPKRRDMRTAVTMTIDPHDAKDFDDALSLTTLPNGNYEIGIHIADVSHYVTKGSLLDQEARDRGTSVYLVDRVIPMLPEVLSNDLCSLRPHEDRLAFSAVFEMTSDARVVGEWYGQTLINSNRRFSYEEAQTVLETRSGDNLDELTVMMDLGRILRKRRYANGAIAFEQPEVKFELDERGKPIRAFKKVRTETMLMIEDFMLLANERVAEHIYALAEKRKRDHAFIYRIHDVPNPDKIEELSLFLRVLGYEFETNKGIVKATDINKLLKEVTGTPEENLIKTATIRSMAKAIYSTKNIGHFGLAFKYYTHFTSPIRRYPDLLAHRLLRLHLDNHPIAAGEVASFEATSIQSSKRELEAVSAERDSIKFKQVEFMMNSVGKEFDAVITGTADWGIYVQEQEALCEGMVRLASIKSDFFEHQASKYQIRGTRTGKVYRLGDTVRVKLARADAEERQLDFELVDSK